MRIYIEESSCVESSLKRPLMTYTSDIIPRKGEVISFVHYGSYMVDDVTYRVSDDTENNELMWVEIKVERI